MSALNLLFAIHTYIMTIIEVNPNLFAFPLDGVTGEDGVVVLEHIKGVLN